MQGHQEAQVQLGSSYFTGKGVEQDYTESYAWQIIAKANGSQRDIFLTSPLVKLKAELRAKELHEQIQANIAERDQAN